MCKQDIPGCAGITCGWFFCLPGMLPLPIAERAIVFQLKTGVEIRLCQALSYSMLYKTMLLLLFLLLLFVFFSGCTLPWETTFYKQLPPPILKAEADGSLWVDLGTVSSAGTIHPAHTNM